MPPGRGRVAEAPAMATVAATPRGYLERPRPSGLADVIDVILDNGIVIDAYVRVAVVGIELLTIDARIVIASDDQAEGLPQLIESMKSGGRQLTLEEGEHNGPAKP